jgi:hypothetical protein
LDEHGEESIILVRTNAKSLLLADPLHLALVGVPQDLCGVKLG